MKLPHTNTRRNSPTRISQGKPTRHSNLQIPTTPSPNNRYDALHPCKRMAHPNVQNLEKQRHTATPTKEDTNNQTRQLTRRKHMIHNTDHTVEGKLKTSKRERLGGGRIQTRGTGLQRSWGHRTPHGRAPSTTRLETVL